MKKCGSDERKTGETTSSMASAENIPSLKEICLGKFDFGAAAPQSAFRDPKLMELISTQFNILTPENELKPNYVIDWDKSRKKVQETNDQTAVEVRLDNAKPLLDFARDHGIKVHGHVLVWHIETNEEFFHETYDASAPKLTREDMPGRLENYIAGLMECADSVQKRAGLQSWERRRRKQAGHTLCLYGA